jgi:hypothetical protein
MKTKQFLRVALACTAIAGFATAGCANGSARSTKSAGTLTLDLQAYPKDTVAGGYWSGTYNSDSTTISFGEFVFSHSGSGGYWDGFTYGTNGDSARYGIPCPVQPCDTTHSVPWIDHQWGVMAAGGLTTPPTVVKGAPYLVAYWGYYSESQGIHSLKVTLADGSLFAPQEVYICNHPWPYWGNIYGDGFARPLNQPDDHFYLWIHAVKADGREDSIYHVLALYEEGLYQPSVWEAVDLSSFFERDNDSIQSLYFTMESTDADPEYGPNTATYFNIDKLKVVKAGSGAQARTVQKAAVDAANKTAKAVEVTDYFPVPSYAGGEVTVFDATGKVVLTVIVRAGERINLSKLPKGEYRLRHGHKHIPVIKK